MPGSTNPRHKTSRSAPRRTGDEAARFSSPALMLVDDHPMWRETLRRVLEHKRVGRIVAEASDGEEALELLRRTRPDVVIMDIDMPEMDGVEATRRLLAERPDLKVLVLSAFKGRAEVIGAVRAGASGYMLKTAPSSEVAAAVGRISSGDLVLPSSLMEVVRQELGEATPAPPAGAERGTGRGSREPQPSPTPVVNAFLREGEFWTLAFDGEVARVGDSKGMGWIACLLRAPGREFHALDLASARGMQQASRRGISGEMGLQVGGIGDAGEMLDPKAKAAYRARLQELRDELAEAESWGDPERAAKARRESDFIAQQLSAAVGLGGRDRRAASAAERARLNVTRAIKRAIDRIRGPHPALGRHLDKAIKTGIYCSYDPERAHDWTL